jgi:Na+-transporting methylmalonyl-CoA/oxaloacetate decarboxylase gamma subunit
MDSITIYDGLILTIVSMLVVFAVLAAIWGLVELTGRFISKEELTPEATNGQVTSQATSTNTQSSNTLSPNKKHQQAAEMMALILASENKPDKKFEITESKRIK